MTRNCLQTFCSLYQHMFTRSLDALLFPCQCAFIASSHLLVNWSFPPPFLFFFSFRCVCVLSLLSHHGRGLLLNMSGQVTLILIISPHIFSQPVLIFTMCLSFSSSSSLCSVSVSNKEAFLSCCVHVFCCVTLIFREWKARCYWAVQL